MSGCEKLQGRRREGFTLIELLVVMGILATLMGVAMSGLAQARRQAQIAKANTEVRELVNSILAYEMANGALTINGDQEEATSELLKPLLGSEGGKVYLNATISAGAFRDPWGQPYRVCVFDTSIGGQNRTQISAAVMFPNRKIGIAP